jgi:hypothetical protein
MGQSIHHSLDLVDEDLGGRPGDAGLVLVHTVHEGTATADVVDRVVDDGLNTGALGDDVKAVCRGQRVQTQAQKRVRSPRAWNGIVR